MDANSLLKPKLKKGYVEVAIAEDRNLAKDYRDLLLSQGISAEISKSVQENDREQFDYTISVKEKDFNLAVKAILSRNPGEYFFDSLFEQEDKLDQLEQEQF